MTSSTFAINKAIFNINTASSGDNALCIQSVPRPYVLTMVSGPGLKQRLAKRILACQSPLLLMDDFVFNTYLKDSPELVAIPQFKVEAVEKNKTIEKVLEIIEFLEVNRASKSSMLFVIGGGILQDLGAFSAYIFKRGIPWTYVPTTLLSQGDSCVGGKTALNHRQTKNLLALFSAPREVYTDMEFLASLNDQDWLSGCGELFRLCVTGGTYSVEIFEKYVEGLLNRDFESTSFILKAALKVKKLVVEYDEFELDIRRSMNYGHSFGHALEARTSFAVPHGISVSIGMLVENEISYRRGLLKKSERDRLAKLGKRLISNKVFETLSTVNLNGILSLLKNDKKAESTTLKLATLSKIGQIDFIDLNLDAEGEREVLAAYQSTLTLLNDLRQN